MILAVSGWRKWNDADFIAEEMAKMQQRGYTRLRVGDSGGADEIAWNLAFIAPVWVVTNRFKATWRDQFGRYDNAAGFKRNHAMLTGDFGTSGEGTAPRLSVDSGVHADLLLAFPQPGKRRPGSGTWLCIEQATQLGIAVYIPGYKKR